LFGSPRLLGCRAPAQQCLVFDVGIPGLQNGRNKPHTTAYYDGGPCVLWHRQRDVNPVRFQGEGVTLFCKYCDITVRSWEERGKPMLTEEEAAKQCGCANCGAPKWWEKRPSQQSSFHGLGQRGGAMHASSTDSRTALSGPNKGWMGVTTAASLEGNPHTIQWLGIYRRYRACFRWIMLSLINALLFCLYSTPGI
jgi:hypothetical protein